MACADSIEAEAILFRGRYAVEVQPQTPGLNTSSYPDSTLTHHLRHLRVGLGDVVNMVNLLESRIR